MMGEQTETADLEAARVSDDSIAWDRIVPLVYTELRAIAHRQLRRERESHTLNTTALVHEAFLRLADQTGIRWQSEAHFFAIAARVMRQVLVDYARYHRAAKRAGAHQPIELDAIEAPESGARAMQSLLADERADVLVALDEALARLSSLDKRLVRVVECRFFGGLTEQETAQALGVTARTVRRDWVTAKAWLQRALDE
jgi:RNA polymerase sigma factor (TIGR02999 family)